MRTMPTERTEHRQEQRRRGALGGTAGGVHNRVTWNVSALALQAPTTIPDTLAKHPEPLLMLVGVARARGRLPAILVVTLQASLLIQLVISRLYTKRPR